MADRPRAMSELVALLDARSPLYAQADVTLDTRDRDPEQLAQALATQLAPG
jgi:hypothetical protein